MVTRLVWAKGLGLVLGCIEEMLPKGIQFAVLGTGDREIEVALTTLAARWPEQVSVRLTYDEALSHQFYAGADFFVMPSLFEPCGLSQLYSLRYGTAPIVRKTGGLADTVTDASPANLAKQTATGIVFAQETPAALRRAFMRALYLYEDEKAFKNVRRTGMQEDNSWDRASRQYLDLYDAAADAAAKAPAVWTS
jgi:starch synthase